MEAKKVHEKHSWDMKYTKKIQEEQQETLPVPSVTTRLTEKNGSTTDSQQTFIGWQFLVFSPITLFCVVKPVTLIERKDIH